MEIISNQLTKQQKREVIKLVETCNKKDNLHQSPFLEHEWNYNPQIPCFFLYYKEKQLVSFLSLFLPEEQEIEINAYTSPPYRRRGYFSYLLKKAIQVLKEYSVSLLTFLIEAHCKNSLYILNSFGAEYLYSEYIMELAEQKKEDKFKNNSVSKQSLSFLPAAIEDIESLSKIHAEAFQVEIEASQEFLAFLKEKETICYKLTLKNQIIGFCSALCNSDIISIFGFCIDKKFQGQGYGKEMMAEFIEYLKTYQRKICLQVNSKNIKAVHLYESLGFTINIDFSYYSVKIQNL